MLREQKKRREPLQLMFRWQNKEKNPWQFVEEKSGKII